MPARIPVTLAKLEKDFARAAAAQYDLRQSALPWHQEILPIQSVDAGNRPQESRGHAGIAGSGLEMKYYLC